METTAGHTIQSKLGNLPSTENVIEKDEENSSINEYNNELSVLSSEGTKKKIMKKVLEEQKEQEIIAS